MFLYHFHAKVHSVCLRKSLMPVPCTILGADEVALRLGYASTNLVPFQYLVYVWWLPRTIATEATCWNWTGHSCTVRGRRSVLKGSGAGAC